MVECFTHSCSPPFRAFGTRWFPPSDHFEIHSDGPESELTSRRLELYVTFSCSLSLSHKVFWVRCGNNCIDSSHLPSSLLFILTRVPTHKKKTVYCVILSDQIVVGCPLGVPITYYISMYALVCTHVKSLSNKICLI